jgi:hypothetical protein
LEGVKQVYLLHHWKFIIQYSILNNVSPSLVDQQFGFQKFGNFNHRIIVFAGRFLEFVGINRNTCVDIVIQREHMAFIREVPRKSVKIVLFVGKTDLQIVQENVGYLIKAFQPTVIVNNGFDAAKICA